MPSSHGLPPVPPHAVVNGLLISFPAIYRKIIVHTVVTVRQCLIYILVQNVPRIWNALRKMKLL
jgi:hypothetical protein